MDNSFLGRGWGFPPTFVHRDIESSADSHVEMLEGGLDIQSSLSILLSTRLGERVMQPRFGTSLNKMMFEPIDTTFATLIKSDIEKAILFFEHRIDINNIDISVENRDDGLVLVKLDYTIRATNTRENLVYPFYINSSS